MSVFGFIESFPNGDVGIVTQTPYNETTIKLNGQDFQLYLGELMSKAKKMGLYVCDCEKVDHNKKSAPSCFIKSKRPIDPPNAKVHGGGEGCKD
jgi:hypothetical protein